MSNDIWEFGEGYHKVHTESIDVAKKIAKICNTDSSTEYVKDGYVFAWDFVVEDSLLPKVKKIVRGHIAAKSSVS